MSDVALFSSDRFYRSQFGTGQASYTVFQKDGVTYADPGYPGGTPYSDTIADKVIQNAINGLGTTGGKIHIKSGIYIITASLVINRSFLLITGENWSATELKAANSLNAPILKGDAVSLRYYLTVRDLSFDGNKANQTSGNGLDLTGCNGAHLQHVRVHDAKGHGLFANGAVLASDSVRLHECLFDSNGDRGLLVQSGFGWYTTNSSFNANAGAGVNVASGGEHGFSCIEIDGANPWGVIMDGTSTNRFDNIWIGTASNYAIRIDNIVNDCLFDMFTIGAGTPGGVNFSTNAISNRNRFFNFKHTGGGGTTGILFNSGITGQQNYFDNCELSQCSTIISGTIPSGFVLKNIGGFTPQGWAVTSPSVPATGVDQTNALGFPVKVYITGLGSGITAVGITDPLGTLQSFTRTGELGDFYHVDPGGKIRISYTGSPTWKWYGL